MINRYIQFIIIFSSILILIFCIDRPAERETAGRQEADRGDVLLNEVHWAGSITKDFTDAALCDDANFCNSLKDILENVNYKVKVAHSGIQALELTHTNNFDIIFIDIKIPILNGLEIYRKIREIKPNVTAIMMTGYRQETSELIQEAMNSSVYTCLFKPVDPELIITLLNQIK